jgi:hypothetical protein
MKIFNIYENVLVEERTKGAESCIKNFGYELFGDQIGYREPNTGIENKFSQMIYRFTDDAYGEQLSTDNLGFVAAMNKLKNCMSAYPEILIPSGGAAFRGIGIPFKSAIELYQKHKDRSVFKLKYNPWHYIESSSENRDVADDFAGMSESPWLMQLAIHLDSLDDAPAAKVIEMINTELPTRAEYESSRVGFTVVSKTNPEEFLFKSKYFSNLSGTPAEDEILRMSKTPFVAEWRAITPEIFTRLIPYIIMYKNELAMFE